MLRDSAMCKKRMCWIVFILITISLMSFFFHHLSDNDFYKDAIFLNDNWQVYINDKEYNNINLNKFSFCTANMGDLVTYSCRLPDVPVASPCIRIYTAHSSLKVYLDKKEIYSYTSGCSSRKKMAGCGYHWVALPDDFQGKTLTIVNEVKRNQAFSNLFSPVLENSVDAIPDFLKENRVAIYIGIFVAVFGYVALVVSILFIVLKRDFKNLLWISLYSICVGTWTLCNTRIIQMVSFDFSHNVLLETLALYLGAIPIVMFYYEEKKQYQELKKGFAVVIGLNILFLIYSSVLHLAGIKLLNEQITTYHIILLLDLTWIVGISLWKYKKQRFNEKILLYAIAGMSVFVLTDMFLFNMQKYKGYTMFSRMKCLSAIGFLILLFGLLGSYLAKLLDNYLSRAERELLEKLAYTDALTGLGNRQLFERKIEYLQTEKIEYGMMIFDLNNLKYVNDNYGHKEGDKFILAFAKCLTETFKDRAILTRIGGDEFSVIIENAQKEQMEDRVKNLLQTMQNLNQQKQLHTKLSTAYGMAFSTESENPEMVFTLADDRMFAHKVKMKQKSTQ